MRICLIAILSVAVVAISPLTAARGAVTPRSGSFTSSRNSPQAPKIKSHQPVPRISLWKLPMSFEPNRGQSDRRVKFLSRGSGYALFLTPTEAVLAMRTSPLIPLPKGRGAKGELGASPRARDAVVRIALKGSALSPRIEGVDRMVVESDYFIGSAPRKWHTDVANYATVELKNVYPESI